MNLVASNPEIAPIYETGYLRNLLGLCEQASQRSTAWRSRFLSQIRGHFWRGGFNRVAGQFAGKVLPFYKSTDLGKRGKTKDEFFPFGNRCIEYTYCELVNETKCFLDALADRDKDETNPFLLGRRYIDRLFAIHCARMKRPFWVNKTPSLVRCLDLLRKMYPECAIVHIVRDGRDVALSTISLRNGPNNVRDAARRWKDMILSSRRLEDRRRYREIRYEDLIAAPQQTMAEIFTLLGFTASAWVTPPDMGIYRHREKVWRDGLTKKDKIIFAKEAGDLLIALGYENNDGWVG